MIDLVAGDPNKVYGDEECETPPGEGKKPTGASYTRFIFPFAFSPVPERTGSKRPRLFFEQCGREEMNMPDWLRRRRYFTPETDQVLYESASWFVLKERIGNGNERESSGRTIRNWQGDRIFHLFKRACRVAFSKIQLVLFEWNPEFGGQQHFEQSTQNLFYSGFLLIDCHFLRPKPSDAWQSPTFEDLLVFNELFRYWRCPFDDHAQCMADFFGEGHILPDLLTKDARDAVLRDFYLERWLRVLEISLLDSHGRRWRLFPDEWSENTRKWWGREASSHKTAIDSRKQDSPHCLAYMDDRAFVWTCALIKDGGAKRVKRRYYHDDTPAEEMGHWIKLLNVDRPDVDMKTATDFEMEWCKDRTYKRWEHYGTLYGFNYHSGAMLAGPIADPPTWDHYRKMYADMILLMLYVRVTLFRFSKELSRLSFAARRETNVQEANLHNGFKRLRKDFMLFTNLYQFPLISNHQQAIEMYTRARRYMDVDDLFKEIQQEVNSTHEFIEVTVTSSIQKRAEDLALFAVPASLVAIFLALFSLAHEWKLPFSLAMGFEDGTIAFPLSWQILIAFLVGVGCWRYLRFRVNKEKSLDI